MDLTTVRMTYIRGKRIRKLTLTSVDLHHDSEKPPPSKGLTWKVLTYFMKQNP